MGVWEHLNLRKLFYYLSRIGCWGAVETDRKIVIINCGTKLRFWLQSISQVGGGRTLGGGGKVPGFCVAGLILRQSTIEMGLSPTFCNSAFGRGRGVFISAILFCWVAWWLEGAATLILLVGDLLLSIAGCFLLSSFTCSLCCTLGGAQECSCVGRLALSRIVAMMWNQQQSRKPDARTSSDTGSLRLFVKNFFNPIPQIIRTLSKSANSDR